MPTSPANRSASDPGAAAAAARELGPVGVIGAGLAGVLVALALARRGAAVTLFGRFEGSATALSYGGLLGRAAASSWRELERCHGPLGWQSARVALHGWPAPLNRLPPGWQALATRAVPASRIAIEAWAAALPAVLERAGVLWRPTPVIALARSNGAWTVQLEPPVASDPASVTLSRLVLAAGVGCRALWPSLDSRLRTSWAGVLELPRWPAAGSRWLAPARRGALVLPRRWRRPGLEAGAGQLQEPAWIVDAGLVPRGRGGLAGQISLVRPEPGPGPPPDPVWMEQQLRRGLAELDPALAELEGGFRQVPVAFCTDGQPLLGPLPDAPGVWIAAGFSAPFATLPAQAERLAAAVLASPG